MSDKLLPKNLTPIEMVREKKGSHDATSPHKHTRTRTHTRTHTHTPASAPHLLPASHVPPIVPLGTVDTPAHQLPPKIPLGHKDTTAPENTPVPNDTHASKDIPAHQVPPKVPLAHKDTAAPENTPVPNDTHAPKDALPPNDPPAPKDQIPAPKDRTYAPKDRTAPPNNIPLDPWGPIHSDEVRRRFPTVPSPALIHAFQLLRENVSLTVDWACASADSHTTAKQRSGALSHNDAGAITTYRAKVSRAALNTRAAWLTPTVLRNRNCAPFEALDRDMSPSLLLRWLRVPKSAGMTRFVEDVVSRIGSRAVRSGEVLTYGALVRGFEYDAYGQGFGATITAVDVTLRVAYVPARDRRFREPKDSRRDPEHGMSRDREYGNMIPYGGIIGNEVQTRPAPADGAWGPLGGSRRLYSYFRGFVMAERVLVRVEAEVGLVQYRFGEKLFMEFRDEIREVTERMQRDAELG